MTLLALLETHVRYDFDLSESFVFSRFLILAAETL